MALGGGTWLFMNKILPGSYINFISAGRPMIDIASRGYATMAFELDWGIENTVFTVTAEDFQKNSQKLFGYHYGHEKLKGLRDLFQHLKTGYFYRLNPDGEKAKNTYAKAKYSGIRGNDLSISIQADPDNDSKWVVKTMLKTDGVTAVVDVQKGIGKKEELKDNDYVEFLDTLTLQSQSSVALEGGTNGNTVTVANYQKYLELIEKYYFNIIGYAGSDSTICQLFEKFTQRCRETTGAKFQLVEFNRAKVNHEGVISIKNEVKDKGAEKGSLVYWLVGKEASCEINETCTNALYDGEYTVNTNYKQYELEQAVRDGMLMFHNVADPVAGNIDGDTRVLMDINTFTEFSKVKNKDFSYNQVVRVLDQLAIDGSRIFNKYHLGKTPNDSDGRISLWSDFVALLSSYQKVRAIQNFKSDDIPVPQPGMEKNEVLWEFNIQPTLAMEKLYLNVYVV